MRRPSLRKQGDLETMTTVEFKSGPGGTELIARTPERNGASAPPAAPELRQPSAPSPLELRRSVEASRLLGVIEGESKTRPAELEAAVRSRQQFWADTCRKPAEMRLPSKPVIELHCKYGCLFYGPSLHQVQYILDALDAALPSWDAEHPELFYQTLELNFPTLLRNRRRGLFLV